MSGEDFVHQPNCSIDYVLNNVSTVSLHCHLGGFVMEIGQANCSCVCRRILCFYWIINGVVGTLPILGSDNWNYKECCTRTITFCEKMGWKSSFSIDFCSCS